MNKKILVTVVAAALLLCVAVGGTIAYLTATTSQVVNTFSPSSIGLDLTETDTDGEGTANTTKANTYQMVPGKTIAKDPVVTVKKDSEPAYVFVKLVKSSTTITLDDNTTKEIKFDDYLTYTMNTGWTQLTQDADGKAITDLVYYYTAPVATPTAEDGTKIQVLLNNEVKVKNTVTSEMMGYLSTAQNYPTLTITAYAVQYYKNNTAGTGANQDNNGTYFTPAEAWAAIGQ